MYRELMPVDSLIVAPVQPPITVDYVRTHIRALDNSEDVLIASWILGAAQIFEEYTGRQLITTTREMWIDAFPCERKIELPRAPLQSVVSVMYVDGNGDLQSFSTGDSPDDLLYMVKAPAGAYAAPGWIEPIAGACWPITRCESGAVRIQYVAGYGDSQDDLPDLAIAALCWLVGNFDQFRSAVYEASVRAALIELPIGVKPIMDGFKYSAMPTQVLHAPWHGVERSWPHR